MSEVLPAQIFYIYFSPYTAHAIEVDGIVYPTVEHAYQCQRYNNSEIINEIKSATSPLKAWQVSSKYKNQEISDFQQKKVEIMKSLMRLKALQHEEVKKALLDSGEAKIVKHIYTFPPGDGFWDDGQSGEGQNIMGQIWMELREELKK
ncbi:MAG: NADAR family protein [Candidatus Buchananbacteria bacterium]